MRNYPNILKVLTNQMTDERLDRLSEFLTTKAINLKAQDAKALMSQMKEDYAHEHSVGDGFLPDTMAPGPEAGGKALS